MIWLLACATYATPKDDTAPEADTDTDADTDSDTDTDTTTLTGELPSILSVDLAECTVNAGGEIWRLAVTAGDPQGAETVLSGTVAAIVDGTTLDTNDLACNKGRCTGTFSLDADGVGCGVGGTVVFEFIVTDADGNSSAPFAISTE